MHSYGFVDYIYFMLRGALDSRVAFVGNSQEPDISAVEPRRSMAFYTYIYSQLDRLHQIRHFVLRDFKVVYQLHCCES